jgi:hypothetical protein
MEMSDEYQAADKMEMGPVEAVADLEAGEPNDYYVAAEPLRPLTLREREAA